MEQNLSVAKGVFVYKNGFKPNKTEKKRGRPPSRRRRRQSKAEADNLIEGIRDQPWYQSFRSLWKRLEVEIQDLLDSNYSQVLSSLQEFLEDSETSISRDLFPVAVLLTGINQPDHYEQFEMLSEKICEKENVRSTILMSRDAPTLKSAIEHLVAGFICDDIPGDSDDEGADKSKMKVKKGNCIMRALRDWYLEQLEVWDGKELVLAIIIPDFELFNKDVLRDLILTVSYYRCQIPLVLVFGVATTVTALENTLPLQFTSKAKFHVFKSQSSKNNLNAIVERIVLNPRNNFMLSGKTLQLLVEIFLFYDFSISGFVQGLKFCLLEHFSGGNQYSLCDDLNVAVPRLKALPKDDLRSIQRLMSVRRYIETLRDPQDIINLLCEDAVFADRLKEEWLPNVHGFIQTFYVALRALHILMCDLPRSPFGKHYREYYCAITEGVDFDSEEVQTALNFLLFSTKTEFLSKIKQIVNIIEEYQNNVTPQSEQLNEVLDKCRKYEKKIQESSSQIAAVTLETTTASPNLKVGSRQELKDKLMEMSKQQQNQRSQYQVIVVKFLDYLRCDFFKKFLVPLKDGPAGLELFLFSDSQTLRKHIVGAPRAAVHQALLNPNHYLQCECCELDAPNQLTPSQPDLSIAYKLHLECGKMINLYDWLQAFKAIMSRDEDEDEDSSGRHVDPVVLARFSRAISELQFLGFIKSSKRKTDHVNRLTW